MLYKTERNDTLLHITIQNWTSRNLTLQNIKLLNETLQNMTPQHNARPDSKILYWTYVNNFQLMEKDQSVSVFLH